jgi:hypothetical protein
MILADRVAECREPFIVLDSAGRRWTLNNTADCAAAVTACPTRYVLADPLTRLCADLAYSKGAHTLACADLLHIPATLLWVEWCNAPWQDALHRYGFPLVDSGTQWIGRRGALIRGTSDGRRGLVRTFWTAGLNNREALASSVEAYFDFDTPDGEAPEPLDGSPAETNMRVRDEGQTAGDDVLARCVRFRYERSWYDYYYAQEHRSDAQTEALRRHTLGTIAMDIPMLLAFFLLLSTRNGLPQQRPDLTRLNQTRRKLNRLPLLDHIEVRAPLLPAYATHAGAEAQGTRRSPRLHHVRGHLMRHGSQLVWRVPHLRGRARSGRVQTRTVVWTFDGTAAMGGRARPQQHDGSASVTACGEHGGSLH